MTPVQRRVVFLVVCIAAVAIPVLYVSRGSHPITSLSTPDPPIEIVPLDRVPPSRAGILFRSTRSDQTFGKVVFLPIDALDGPWYVSTLTCDRVYFRAADLPKKLQ